ncbi:hypothetical protein BN14_08875 [Rhizoctonia solani AG-1 IB]|uniref:Uncharacterized protein n=1 Tax=Thanatephorus cucumeris (strain AG1-IB / isolate 7/3/14) TaxID=1108050 RepID=M5CFJ1_THACB|nr:hypothetical protein BN14_08875 [Rhizoctonia solani AG-1 IB]
MRSVLPTPDSANCGAALPSLKSRPNHLAPLDLHARTGPMAIPDHDSSDSEDGDISKHDSPKRSKKGGGQRRQGSMRTQEIWIRDIHKRNCRKDAPVYPDMVAEGGFALFDFGQHNTASSKVMAFGLQFEAGA